MAIDAGETDDPVRAANERLECEIKFYDKSSLRKRRLWRSLASVELLVAASVPAAAALGASTGVLGLLGAVVVVCRGLLTLFQSQSRYVAHRGTYERLVREKALYRAHAGPYRIPDDEERAVALAERVEAIRQEETEDWVEEERRLARRARGQSGDGTG